MIMMLLGLLDILAGISIYLTNFNFLLLAQVFGPLFLIKGAISGLMSLKSPFFLALSILDFVGGVFIMLAQMNILTSIAGYISVALIFKGIWSFLSLK